MNESEENFTINSKSILESLYEKNKQFEWILNRDEIKRKTNSLFGNLMFKVPQIRESVCNFGLKSGVIFINDTDLLFLEKKDVLGGFYITYFSVEEISINDLKSFFQDVDDNSFTYCYPSGEKVKYNLSKPEMVFLKTYIDLRYFLNFISFFVGPKKIFPFACLATSISFLNIFNSSNSLENVLSTPSFLLRVKCFSIIVAPLFIAVMDAPMPKL